MNASGSESLAEFARNAGMDNPERAWLLDPRDVWVRNPFYNGPSVPHPEDDEDIRPALIQAQKEDFERQFTEWRGNSDGTVGCD